MKTACFLASLALSSAVAPPRVSVSLDGEVVAATGALKSNVGKLCQAGTATPANCPYPVASAFDHHDKEVKVQQQVWKMVNGGVPSLVCDTEKGSACDASIVNYDEPGEYLFLYNAQDKAGNKAMASEKDAKMEGHNKKFSTASVTFNLVLEDLTKPVICYNQLYSAADLKKAGQFGCDNGGFKTDDDKIFTVQGGVKAAQFKLENSLVHDDITVPAAMDITYTIAACPAGTTDASAIEGGCKGSPMRVKAQDLTVPAKVQSYINSFISGVQRDTGYVAIRMDAHDTAGIYGAGNKNNFAKPLIVAVKVIDTAAPAITIEGAEVMADMECGSKAVFPAYNDAGASYTEQLDRCTTSDCGKSAPRDADGNLVALTGSCTKGKSGYCHFADNFAAGKCAPQYEGKCAAGKVAGKFQVTYVATDRDNNRAEAIRQLSVVDTTAPVLSLNVKGTDGVVYECGKGKSCDTLYSTKSHHSDNKIEEFDAGFTVTDSCDEHIGAAQVTKSWGKQPFDRRVLGAYIRTYTATDAAGNTASQTRTFHVVDEEKPMITMAGKGSQTIEATRETEYYDAGATCDDFVDGILNHRVKVSGDIVDLTVVGTYKINYNCEDLTGNAAVRATRTVVVTDTQAPTITVNGKSSVTVEAGFPYHEEGATASDSLDGEITYCSEKQNSIVAGDLTVSGAKPVLKEKNCLRVIGDSVNTFYEYNSRKSCRDIYAAAAARGETAKSGLYTITATVAGDFKHTKAYCNMESAEEQKTFKFINKEGNPTQRGNTCRYWGMKALQKKDVSAIDNEFFAGLHILGVPGTTFLPIPRKQTGYYCYTVDAVAPASTLLSDLDCSEDDASHRCTRSGTYYIKYSTKDLSGNVAEDKIRTVNVVDTLPPVISLHFKAKKFLDEQNSVTRKASDMPSYPRHEYVIQTSEPGVSSADDHEKNPAQYPAHNPNLHNGDYYPKVGFGTGINRDSYMAESATSVNAWLIAAAASAVAGVALLAASSKKTVTSVPV